MKNYFVHNDKAVSLHNIRTIRINEGQGKSAIRFTIMIDYQDDSWASFDNLTKEEARDIFDKILKILNEE